VTLGGAMQRGEVPLRVIDGEIDPISGAHMVERYQQLVPHADTVLLANIGHYPQIEARCRCSSTTWPFVSRSVIRSRAWPIPDREFCRSELARENRQR
jgi:pimeloyl-ACP methyl ester carboxylesterase